MPQLNTKIPWPTYDPCAREEWDFKPGFLPNAEVWWCHEYELGRIRQTNAWRQSIEGFRKASPVTQDKYDGYYQNAKSYLTGQKSEDWPELFYTLWPEWPNQPYLVVPAAERHKRINDWCRWNKPPILEQVSLKGLYFDHEYERMRQEAKVSGIVLPPLNRPPSEIGDTISDSSGETIAFKFPRHLSEEEEVEMFRAARRKHRQANGIVAPERRGAGGHAKQLRADLIAIGFWRLVRSGKTPREACIFTALHSNSMLVADHKTAWDRALKRAERLLRFHLGKRFDP